MARMTKRSVKPAGVAPGTVVHVGRRRAERTKITVYDYSEESLAERELASVEDCVRYKETSAPTWINVDGLHDVKLLSQLGEAMGISPLLTEDIANTSQRPKAEDFGPYLFIVLKMLRWHPQRLEIEAEQVSLVLAEKMLLTFQEYESDLFAPIRERLRANHCPLRRMGVDYLAYALIDTIVDNYFVVLEAMGDEIEDLEDRLVEQPGREALADLYRLKREMLFVRRWVWPAREVVGALERRESRLVHPETVPYLRDAYDHVVQIIDTIETQREMLSNMLDVYLTSISNRMNEVMKVLTLVATIFIPLTFIAGVYGMNFEHMPELRWRWAYFALWGVMLAVAGGMLIVFRRKKWI